MSKSNSDFVSESETLYIMYFQEVRKKDLALGQQTTEKK